MKVYPEKFFNLKNFLKIVCRVLPMVLPMAIFFACSAKNSEISPLHSLNSGHSLNSADINIADTNINASEIISQKEDSSISSIIANNSLSEKFLVEPTFFEKSERVNLGDKSISMQFAESKIISEKNNIKEEIIIEEFYIPLTAVEIKHSAFLIEEPRRLVLDIFSENSSKPLNISLENSKYFSKIRFASHPDKKRFVFDFIEDNSLAGFEVEKAKEELVLRVSEVENLEIAKVLKLRSLQDNALVEDVNFEPSDIVRNDVLASPDFEEFTNKSSVAEEIEDGNNYNLKENEEIDVALNTVEEEVLIEEKLTKKLAKENDEEDSLANYLDKAVGNYEENKIITPKLVTANEILPEIKLVAENDQLIKEDIQEEGIKQDEIIASNIVKIELPKEELVKEELVEEVQKNNQVKEEDQPLQLVKAEDSRALLKVLQLDNVREGQNELLVGLDESRYYSFKQISPTNYELVINNTKIADNLNDILSDKKDGKIRTVKTKVDGGNLIINIFAEPNTLLMTQADGSKVYVRSIVEEKEVLRAQVKEDAPIEEELEVEEELELVPEEDDLTEFFTVDQKYTGRLISLDLQDTEIDNALRIIAEVSNLNIISSEEVTGKVTLRLVDVPWDQALDVILKTNGLDKVQEGNVIRIAPVEKLRLEREALRQAQQAEEELEPLKVQYLRVSYAKAASLQPLIETVITERGTVAYDERSNQIIVKDISKGLKNVAKLVEKLDLRTPQVLIETQIVEANRSFVRELGSELGFFYLRSPETGNALGSNFPNTVQIGGSAIDSSGLGQSVSPNFSFFPASNAASAVSALFGSADGSKGLQLRLTQAETEGDVRTISRPSVAVTNNSPAVIKSVTKLRVRLPNGGVTVASGQGAQSQGQGNAATETIEIGIVLNVTAQASPDYYVLMDINAKSSTLGPLALGVEQIPPEIERSATSSVLVSSGQTFAMGGIYRVSEDDNTVGVPFLKNIPFLGQFFRRSSVNNSDEELIFFITPRIIEGSFDDASMNKIASN